MKKMINYKLDYFFNTNVSKDCFSTNLQLIKNKISNKPIFKNNNDKSSENNTPSIRKVQRPLSSKMFSNNIKDLRNINIKKSNELLKPNITNNNRNKNIKNINNINSILEVSHTNNSTFENNNKEIKGRKILQDFILKKLISLSIEENKLFSSKKYLSNNNNNQLRKNNNQKRNIISLPFFNYEKGNKTQLYKNENLNETKSMAPSNEKNTKIMKYFTNTKDYYFSNKNERNRNMAKNETFQKNNLNNFNNILIDSKSYNSTMNSTLLKRKSNNRFPNVNINKISLMYSYQHGPNTSNERKKQNRFRNYKLLNSKEEESLKKENHMKLNDNLNYMTLNKNNNINYNLNLRTLNEQKTKLKLEVNNNYFLDDDFLKNINSIKKIYKEKESKKQNLKCFYYLVLPGNASYLIEKCMIHRINWVKAFSVVSNLFNFKWQEISYGIDYTSLGYYQNVKQIVNHFENHFVISNKAKLFTNLLNYCERRKISVFKYVPFTIIFHLKDEEDEEENEKNNMNVKKVVY